MRPDLRADLFAFARAEGRAFSAARGHLLQAPAQRTSPLFLLTAGAAHVYYDLPTGQRQTLRLGYPGEVLAALPGYFLGVPSPLGIEALRQCRGYLLDRGAVAGFCASTPQRQAGYTYMLEAFVCGLVEREIDLLEHDPAQRYAALAARSPQVLQHIPLRYIASYLRMTPETLSRVRRRAAASEP